MAVYSALSVLGCTGNWARTYQECGLSVWMSGGLCPSSCPCLFVCPSVCLL